MAECGGPRSQGRSASASCATPLVPRFRSVLELNNRFPARWRDPPPPERVRRVLERRKMDPRAVAPQCNPDSTVSFMVDGALGDVHAAGPSLLGSRGIFVIVDQDRGVVREFVAFKKRLLASRASPVSFKPAQRLEFGPGKLAWCDAGFRVSTPEHHTLQAGEEDQEG